MNGFVEINTKEIYLKIKGLLDEKGLIKLWKKSQKNHVYRIKSGFVEQSAQELVLFSEDEVDAKLIGDVVFMSFVFRGVNYFSRGTLSECPEGPKFIFEQKFYRYEKRKNERLLAYPHLEIFLLAEIEDEILQPDNVVFLSKEKEEKKKKLEEDQEKALKILKKIQSELGDGLSPFRVIDLSSKGVSLKSSKRYLDFFKKKLSQNFTVLIDGQLITVNNLNLVYIVDLFKRADEPHQYKIGLEFDECEKLEKIINEKIDESNFLYDVTRDKEFETIFTS